MEPKNKEFIIPDFEVCRKYLPEAEKIDTMPEDETDIISLNFEPETMEQLDILASSWNVTVERVLQTMLIALVRENKNNGLKS